VCRTPRGVPCSIPSDLRSYFDGRFGANFSLSYDFFLYRSVLFPLRFGKTYSPSAVSATVWLPMEATAVTHRGVASPSFPLISVFFFLSRLLHPSNDLTFKA